MAKADLAERAGDVAKDHPAFGAEKCAQLLLGTRAADIAEGPHNVGLLS